MKELWMMSLAICLSFSSLISAQANELILAADEWCPYNCEPGSERQGYMVDLAVDILGEAGHTVKYRALNWSRSIEWAREGKFHGIIGASKQEAPDFIYPEEPQGIAENHFWVLKGDPWRFNGINSLEGRWLGIIQDYDYGKALSDFIKTHGGTLKAQERAGDDALDVLIKKLIHGRINVLNEDKNVFLYKINSMNKKELFADAGYDMTPLQTNYIYIAFSPHHKEAITYAKLLNDGIKRYRKNGKLNRILSRYGLTDWKK